MFSNPISTTVKRTSSSLLRAHSLGSFSRLVFESEISNGPAEGETRDWGFRLTQTFVILLRLFTPCSYLVLIAMVLLPNVVTRESLGGALGYNFVLAACLVEACFFPYYYFLFTQVNAHNKKLQHFACDREVRFNLVKNCFQAMALAAPAGGKMITDPEVYIRKVIEGWFLDVPILQIYRGNFASWCGWAFFGKDVSTMSQDELQENETIVNYIENMAGWRFPDGFNDALMSARLTLDPVFATQRPFFFYASIWLVNTITHVALFFLGYRRKPQFGTAAANVYHRPSRASSSDTKGLPIVFIHGIGIGFAHYMGLVCKFPEDVDVYLLEWPHVAMQMAKDVPTVSETVDTILSFLKAGGHDKACFVAHSLGSTAVSWMLHSPVGRTKVASTVLLDPVTFLLCDPCVATTFVYKAPQNSVDYAMKFFLSQELFISNALSRHFSWSHNICFVEDLEGAGVDAPGLSPPQTRSRQDNNATSSPRRGHALSLSEMAEEEVRRARLGSSSSSSLSSASSNGSSSDLSGLGQGQEVHKNNYISTAAKLRHTIFLSSNDSIVPVGPVSRYLEGKRREGHDSFEVTFFHGLHGEIFLYPEWLQLIAAKVNSRCRLEA